MLLIALVPAGLLLPQQMQLARAHPRLACVMSAKDSGGAQTLTITLNGCSDGIGVGLDDKNCVDLLRPGLPAAKALQLGDKVIQWNGNKMVDEAGERRMLKDVVVPADSHELLVERQPSLAPLAGEWESGLTCVEYAHEKEGELRLGVYVAYSMDEAEPHIRPLCASSSEDGVSALLCDEPDLGGGDEGTSGGGEGSGGEGSGTGGGGGASEGGSRDSSRTGGEPEERGERETRAGERGSGIAAASAARSLWRWGCTG